VSNQQLNFQTEQYDVLIKYQDSYQKGQDDAYWVQSILKRFLDMESEVTTYDIDAPAGTKKILIGVETESTNKLLSNGGEKWPKDSERPVNWHKGCSIPLRKIKYDLEHPDRDCFWIKLNYDATRSLILDFDRIAQSVESGDVQYIIGDCTAYNDYKKCYKRCWSGKNPAQAFKQGYRNGSKCAMMIMVPWNDKRLGKYSCDNGFREWAAYINRFCFSKVGFVFDEPNPEIISFVDNSLQTALF